MKNQPFTMIADTHGIFTDWQAFAAFMDFCKYFKPKFKLHGGDWIDVPALRNGADEDDQTMPLTEDIDMGKELLSKYDPHVLLVGNHDYRLYKMAQSRNQFKADLGKFVLQDVTSFMERQDIHVVKYGAEEGVYKHGDHLIAHGYHHGARAVAQNAEFYGQNNITFHLHTSMMGVGRTLRPAKSHVCACMCHLPESYSIGRTGAVGHHHGFIYGYKLPDGRLDVRHAMIDSEYNLLIGDV